MGNVFDNLKKSYGEMFQGTVGPASAPAFTASAAAAAQAAYESQPAGTLPEVRYQAAKAAVADHLAPAAAVAAPAIEHIFDAVHAQPPAPVTPATSTAQSVKDAARQTATLALGSISGTLKLSGPSLLGTAARVWFGVASAVIAGGSVGTVFWLADHRHSGTVIYIALAIAIFMGMLTVLLCVTGYSNVNIQGSRGNSG